MRKKNLIKKSPYLLLELLIAFFLFGTIMASLFLVPYRALGQELHSLERMELQRYSDLAFAEVKEALYTKSIRWKDLQRSETNKLVWNPKDFDWKRIQKNRWKLSKNSFDMTISLWRTSKLPKNDEDPTQEKKEKIRTIMVEVLFTRKKPVKNERPLSFQYPLWIKKIPKNHADSQKTPSE